MIGETKEKKHVYLMGKPQVKKHGKPNDHPLPISEDAEAMQLFALLLLSREFCPDEGVVTEQNEVRREWLLAKLYPDLFAAEPQRARDRMAYALKKLEAALQIRADMGAMKRERNVVVAALDHLVMDVREIEQAAKQIHTPKNQESVIALADRPLLDGMPYLWLQETPFQKVRVELDSCFLTALARQADSQVVQMERANEAGRLADADACRSKALPLLDKAAERLRGYGGLHGRPEHAPLLPLKAQFLDLRRRAAYPLPDAGEADGAADTVPPPTHNLPSPATSFVGREGELADIQALLTSGRLVTLTGMGGCGKTRLAVQAAWNLLGGWESVRLVELAGLNAPDQIPPAMAAVLGVAEQKGITVTDALTAFLQDKRMLLLLDNCEHLLRDEGSRDKGSSDDGLGDDDCGTIVAALLRSCPTLSVLATSREPLNIAGEHLCRVPPLPFPAPDFLPEGVADPVAALLGYDAARLFVDRALQFRRFTPGPENVGPVAAICAALDGIPLALELAAARVRALPLEQIAEMLSDRFGLLTTGRRESPSRHKTLRAVIDWSYDLLNGAEQGLLRHLSVFAGGWTLDAAEAVGTPEGGDILDLLNSLVDKSMVIADLAASPGRYRMLETVRQYAQDRLREAGGWEETHRRHRDHFLALAEEAAPHLKGPEPTRWLDRLETEVSNLRVALEWRTDEPAVRLACALTRFWLVRGYLQEGGQWLERGARSADDVSEHLRAKALNCAGSLAFASGNFQDARRLNEESLAVSQRTGDQAGIAESLNSLGGVVAHQGDYGEAKTLIEESLKLRRQQEDQEGIAGSLNHLGMIANYQYEYDTAKALLQESLAITRSLQDVRGVANGLNNLAIVAYYQGDYTAAQARFEEALALWRPLGDRYSIAKSFSGLGEIALRLSDYEAAQKNYAESLAMRRQFGDTYGTANSLNGLGEAALSRGDFQAARGFLEESLALRRQMGDTQSIAHSLHNLGEVALRQSEYAAARESFLSSLRLMRESEDQYGIAHSLESLAAACVLPEQAASAARLLGAAETLRVAIGSPRPPSAEEEYRSRVAAVREALGDAAFTAAWEEGWAMSWEQAVAYALEEDSP